jgi:hypothetical protein
MDAQDDSSAEFDFDERTGGGGVPVGWGSEFELEKCRGGGLEWRKGGGPSLPVDERLVGYPRWRQIAEALP